MRMSPGFSIIRIAVQHWAKQVLVPLKEILFEAFFVSLESRRIKNLYYIINGN